MYWSSVAFQFLGNKSSGFSPLIRPYIISQFQEKDSLPVIYFLQNDIAFISTEYNIPYTAEADEHFEAKKQQN